MSAFICHEYHIATCAEIVKQSDPHGLRDTPRADIAVAMAKENLASVAYRYGPEGQAAYAPLLNAIVGGLVESGWKTSDVVSGAPPAEADPLADMLPDGVTVPEYVAACRWAEPVAGWSPAEAHQYLACLAYQSCEHPEWAKSPVREWVDFAFGWLSDRLVRTTLAGRHVWEVPHPTEKKPHPTDLFDAAMAG